MNREEFLDRLRNALSGMSDEERADAAGYFDELIADKAADRQIDEEEVIAGLEPVEKIAQALQAQREQPQAAPERHEAKADDDETFAGLKTIRAKADSVRSVMIDTAHVGIELKPCASNELVLSYTQDEYDVYDFSLTDGALTLKRRPLESLHALRFSFFSRRVPPVTLEVPKEFAASCELSTRNAGIHIAGISFWSWLKLKTSNAGIHLERLSAQGELNAQTSNGAITLTALRVREGLHAQTSNSRLSAADTQAKAITLITSNAKLTADNISAPSSITLSTKNGSLEAAQTVSQGALSLSTSNSGLHIDRIASPDITLATSNGSIKGSIAGKTQDYTVQSHTSNGADGLAGHRGQGPGRLNARTSNGSIQVSFAP